MPLFTPEELEEARKTDLLSYLQSNEPEELVPCSGGYCTRTHDSLKISNGKWMWFSRGFGGRSALDYLIKVRGMPFEDAVRKLIGNKQPESPEAKEQLHLPEKSPTNDKVIEYLTGRGISEEILRDCIAEGLLYESLPRHSAVFVGKNEKGEPAYAAFRALGSSRVMGECAGSDKRRSFRIDAPQSRTVHVFESAIDALSYATLIRMNGGDYRTQTLLSLGGVFPARPDGTGRTPASLELLLWDRPQIGKIYLHLDNDEAGRNAVRAIGRNLGTKYQVVDKPPKYGKDVNDYLCHRLGIERKETREEER